MKWMEEEDEDRFYIPSSFSLLSCPISPLPVFLLFLLLLGEEGKKQQEANESFSLRPREEGENPQFPFHSISTQITTFFLLLREEEEEERGKEKTKEGILLLTIHPRSPLLSAYFSSSGAKI